MSTTIDSLQIEIQTSSSNAGAGIDALAASLERLKKVGSFNVVIKNLNNLSSALDKLQGSSSGLAKLNSLASSIESLKKAGSFGSISNGFVKLGTALKDLESMNIDGAVAKIKELNDKIGPVSKNLVAIGNAFKVVNSKATQTSGGFSIFGGKVNTTTMNLSHFINVAKSVISSLKRIINMFEKTIGDAIEWEGIAQRFGRGFGDQAEEVYSWAQRLNQEMGINTQQFMQYSSTYATMLKGFGVASEDASKMALGYMELTYDIWSGYNDIYKSLDDAATAVRSAIAGEVEPVRKAGFTIIESTLKQTAANHGLKISLENATEAQKSYLRYLTLVDQAKAQGLVGNYAREMNTAEGVMRTFNQQLKSLGQTFGSIFLPALVRIMPWVQAFIDLLGDAVMAAANFFGIDIQKVDFGGSISGSADSATESVNGTTAALKELKNATTGIDELNIISPQSASGSSGSGGGFDGVDVGSLWDESIFDSIQFEVDAIKEQVREALSGIEAMVSGFALAIGAILVLSGTPKTIALGIGLLAAGAVGLGHSIAVNWDGMSEQLAGTLVTITSVLSGFLLAIGAILAFSGYRVGLGIALIAAGAVSLATAATINWKFLEGDLTSTVSLLTGIVSGGLLAIGALLAFSGFKVGLGIALMAAGAVGLASTATLNWDSLSEPMRKKIGTIEAIVGGALLAIGAILAFTGVNIPLGVGLMAAGATSLISAVVMNWDSIVTSIKNTVTKIGIIAGAAMLALGVILCLTGVALPTGIALIAAGAGSLVAGVVLNWDSIKTSIQKALNKIKNWVSTYGLLALGVILCLSGVGIPLGISLIYQGLKKKTDSGSTVGDELLKTIKEKWAAIKKWWDSKPALKKVSAAVENFKNTISDAWSKAKEWWNGKPALASVSATVSSIRDKLSSAWSSAVSWWSNSRPSLSSISVTVDSILGKLSAAWAKAKEWFNKQALKLNIKIPHIVVGWDYEIPRWQSDVANFLFGKKALPYIDIEWYKNGGFPGTDGQLFVANEAGPELVGKIGNRNAVVNNDQIVSAVSEGVYAAVVAAMRATSGNGGSQSVNVYLDGKQITSSVEQRQKERGATLMGSQVYSY